MHKKKTLNIRSEIVRAIRQRPNLTDPQIAKIISTDDKSYTYEAVAYHRKKMRIGSVFTRKRNIVYMFLDENPNASVDEICEFMWQRGFKDFLDTAVYYHREKYEGVKQKRLEAAQEGIKEAAVLFPVAERLAA